MYLEGYLNKRLAAVSQQMQRLEFAKTAKIRKESSILLKTKVSNKKSSQKLTLKDLKVFIM